MHCYICDVMIGDPEFNDDLKQFEPCVTCLDIIYDAAYCDGFEKEDGEVDTVDSSFDDEDRVLESVYELFYGSSHE